MIIFGVGSLFGVPLTNAAGSAIANPTPVQFGVLQEVSSDFSFDEKTLYGAYQSPIAFGRGKAKYDFKAKAANFTAQAIGSLFFGLTPAQGIRQAVVNEAHAVPSSTPWQVTISPPSTGTFVTDLGVQYAATGIQLTCVASAPTTGQYAVSGAGVYTFATADAGLAVNISYEFTATSTAQQYVTTISNQLMGAAPSFQTQLAIPYNGKTLTFRFNNCVSSKLSFPFKNEDFSISEFDFMALADSSNNVGYWSLT